MTTALKKKVNALAKEKDCELVGEWKRSLVNHLYWSAVSTPDGNGDMIKANGCHWIITSTISTRATAKSFHPVSTRHYGEEVERRSGSKHGSLSGSYSLIV